MDNLQRDPEELLPHEDTSRQYRAMRGRRTGGNRVLRLQFVPNKGTHNRRLPLSDLGPQDIAKDGGELILEFSSQTVVLAGRNLAVVDDGIAEGWIAAVEAFDPALRDMPTDTNAPFIARIQFYPVPKEADKKQQKAKPSPKHEPEIAERGKTKA